MYPVSFLCSSLHDIYRKKVVSPYGASLYCLFPACSVTWAWSLAQGQYMVSWLLTGAPEQRYWQNRETANIGLVSSVGRAPARQSGGHRFKTRSSKFVFVHPKYTTQKRLRVKGNFLIMFVSMSSLVWTSFLGVHDFFHQGNKLVSNQKFFCVCFLFVSHQRIILLLVVTILAR